MAGYWRRVCHLRVVRASPYLEVALLYESRASPWTDGDQYSIVYLTTKGWLDITPDVKRQLESIGMPVPDSSWQGTGAEFVPLGLSIAMT